MFRRVVPDPGARVLLALTGAAWTFVIAGWSAYEFLADSFCGGGEFKSDWCPDHPQVTPLLGWSTIGAVGLLGICLALGIALLPLLLVQLTRKVWRATSGR